jgi:hypothetical protein
MKGTGSTYVALAQGAPETYDTCSGTELPRSNGQANPWNRWTVGSMLCVGPHIWNHYEFDHRGRPFRPLCDAADHYLETTER